MRRISAFREAGSVRGVFCDIDDTLTTDGRLTAEAYAAMERLRAAGELAVPVTACPAGWCDCIAPMWPVDAVLGENGAFYFCYDASARIAAIMRASGMTAKVNSIHVNGWFGDHDKSGMTCMLMRERYGIDLGRERAEYAFVGDSPNDAPVFEFFPHSVGVAKVCDFAGRMPAEPAFVTTARCGAGFAEFAEMIISEGASNP